MASKIWVRAIAGPVALGLLIPASVMGQAKGGTTAPPGTGTGTSTGTTPGTTAPSPGRTTTPSTNPTTPSTTPSPSIPQPIFVSGRVTMEDGTAPPDPVVIETVCNGSAHNEGYTDAKGYFSIELGARNGVIQDASEFSSIGSMNAPGMMGGNSANNGGLGGSSTERKYMGCDLQAKLAGFRSQMVGLTGRRPMDDPNIGTILLHRIGPAEEGKTVSAVSLAAPKDAKKAYEKGLDAIKKKKFEDAQKNFEKAVEVYPKYSTAWYELGMLQAGQGKMDMARKYWDTAVECDPKFVKPYLQIAIVELQASRWRGLAEVTDKLVKLDPFDYPQAFFFNSVANYNMQNFEAAEKSALAAEHLDTRHAFPKVSHILGMLMALRKDYAGAAEHFKAYLKFAPTAEDAPKVRSQLAEVEKITAARAGSKDQ